MMITESSAGKSLLMTAKLQLVASLPSSRRSIQRTLRRHHRILPEKKKKKKEEEQHEGQLVKSSGKLANPSCLVQVMDLFIVSFVCEKYVQERFVQLLVAA
ncbi:unnamed protein product [Camellia sinensis]